MNQEHTSIVSVLVTNEVWHSVRYDAALLHRVYAEGRGVLEIIILGEPLSPLPPIKNVRYRTISSWRWFLMPPDLRAARRVVVLDAVKEFGRVASRIPRELEVIIVLERSIAVAMHRASWYARRALCRGLAKARYVLAPTNAIKHEVEGLDERAQVSVMPPPLFVSWIREDTRSLRDTYSQFTLVIALSSDFVTSKGVSQVLMIIPSLLQQYPKLGLVILGNGPARASLEQAHKDLIERGSVVFLGARDDDVKLMQQADIVCLYQTHAVPIHAQLRAIAASTPLVVSSDGLARDVLPETMAHAVPLGNTAALARTLADVIADPDGRVRERASLRTLANKAALTEQNYERRVFAHISQEPQKPQAAEGSEVSRSTPAPPKT